MLDLTHFLQLKRKGEREGRGGEGREEREEVKREKQRKGDAREGTRRKEVFLHQKSTWYGRTRQISANSLP